MFLMNSKKITLIFFLIILFAILIAIYSLRDISSETVVQAAERYALSGHADKKSISFNYWNDNDSMLIPAACAGCHSTYGFLDYLGEDGSDSGTVNAGASVGSVITCSACHNPSAHELDQVKFHSGNTVQSTGTETVCLVCHQSRQSTTGVENALQGLSEDEVSESLSFISPHYNIAASTQYGSDAHSGYEYPGKDYAAFFSHAANVEICTDCHNAHSLKVEPQQCAVCHVQVVNDLDFQNIRTQTQDFDGNGDNSEGVYFEIVSLQERLYKAMQDYTRTTSEIPIVYAAQFPYFYVDTNDNSQADADEVSSGNRYNAWTPRLIKAAYNFMFAKEDPGGYVHNARYVLQLLHDSISDLESINP